MNKTLKKIIIISAIVIGVCGAAVAALLLIRDNSAQVPVYPVSDFMMYGGGAMNETSGMVKTDRMQSVYISATQKVTEIIARVGAKVKTGDKLISYDTTLSDIELEKAQINLERLKLSLQTAEKELKTIKGLSPYSSRLITPEPLGIVYEPHETKVIIAGDGTEESPYYYLWAEDDTMNADDLTDLIDARRQADPAAADVYVSFLIRENNALNAPIMRSFGIYANDEDGLKWSYYEPVLSEEIQAFEAEPESYIKESGSPYSASEIAQMKKDKETEIKDINADIQMAQVELERIRLEVSDGTVCSRIDGVVTIVRDPEEALASGEPVIVVSGGGGFIIEAPVKESDLSLLAPGSTVTVMSWMNGVSAEGVVQSVSEYPVSGYYGGNQNDSYYPVTITVPEDAGLKEDEYVGVSYSTVQNAEELVSLESMFIREESGRNYVMVEDENGRLEKRFIDTAGINYGYIYINGGLTAEDYIAFPYGKDVREGARTRHATIDELYNSAY